MFITGSIINGTPASGTGTVPTKPYSSSFLLLLSDELGSE